MVSERQMSESVTSWTDKSLPQFVSILIQTLLHQYNRACTLASIQCHENSNYWDNQVRTNSVSHDQTPKEQSDKDLHC